MAVVSEIALRKFQTIIGSPNASKSFWYLDIHRSVSLTKMAKRNGWEEALYGILVICSDDRVVLSTDFSHNNVCRRLLVKDNAGVSGSKHENSEFKFNIL